MTLEELHRSVSIAANVTCEERVFVRLVNATARELGFDIDEATGELKQRPAAEPYRPQRQQNVRYPGMRRRR